MKKQKHILLSLVGSNNAGKLKGDTDGVILSALINQKTDEIILLVDKSGNKEHNYELILQYHKNEIKKRKLARRTEFINNKELINQPIDGIWRWK